MSNTSNNTRHRSKTHNKKNPKNGFLKRLQGCWQQVRTSKNAKRAVRVGKFIIENRETIESIWNFFTDG